MPTNPADPINPITVPAGDTAQNGLTKREFLVGAAMADSNLTATQAVKLADEVIKALNTPTEN